MLNQRLGCTLQIGGNDQWGNITSGMDLDSAAASGPGLWHDAAAHHQADGTKFGKTEGGAVLLDPALTSPYAFYQFWLGTADRGCLPLPALLQLYAAGRD